MTRATPRPIRCPKCRQLCTWFPDGSDCCYGCVVRRLARIDCDESEAGSMTSESSNDQDALQATLEALENHSRPLTGLGKRKHGD
jgi:hypothetical protein